MSRIKSKKNPFVKVITPEHRECIKKYSALPVQEAKAAVEKELKVRFHMKQFAMSFYRQNGRILTVGQKTKETRIQKLPQKTKEKAKKIHTNKKAEKENILENVLLPKKEPAFYQVCKDGRNVATFHSFSGTVIAKFIVDNISFDFSAYPQGTAALDKNE
ncbi:MAG: hypothetical protein ACP5OG_02375 [Candidatus Nanoarchaeia archaeon]